MQRFEVDISQSEPTLSGWMRRTLFSFMLSCVFPIEESTSFTEHGVISANTTTDLYFPPRPRFPLCACIGEPLPCFHPPIKGRRCRGDAGTAPPHKRKISQETTIQGAHPQRTSDAQHASRQYVYKRGSSLNRIYVNIKTTVQPVTVVLLKWGLSKAPCRGMFLCSHLFGDVELDRLDDIYLVSAQKIVHDAGSRPPAMQEVLEPHRENTRCEQPKTGRHNY